MPFTPYHVGPGLLTKGLCRQWFDLQVFVLCQVLIDLEVIWLIWQGSPRIHKLMHTYLGSLIPAVVSIAIIVVLYRWLGRKKINYVVLLASGWWGAWSHVALDSLMHKDMQPFWPFTSVNPWLRSMSVEQIHMSCIIGFLLGLLMILLWPVIRVLKK
jgi:hypothetical protein